VRLRTDSWRTVLPPTPGVPGHLGTGVMGRDYVTPTPGHEPYGNRRSERLRLDAQSLLGMYQIGSSASLLPGESSRPSYQIPSWATKNTSPKGEARAGHSGGQVPAGVGGRSRLQGGVIDT
jgi:hypothetical protein